MADFDFKWNENNRLPRNFYFKWNENKRLPRTPVRDAALLLLIIWNSCTFQSFPHYIVHIIIVDAKLYSTIASSMGFTSLKTRFHRTQDTPFLRRIPYVCEYKTRIFSWCVILKIRGLPYNDGLGIKSRWGEIFRPSRPALGPTQPPVQWVPGLSRGSRAARVWCWPLTPF